MTRRADNKGGRRKQQAEAEERTFLSWLFELGEQKLGQVAEEVVSNPKVMDALGNAFQKAAQTKGQMDRNMQLLLSLLNVPSKADYERLLGKIESLHGSLVNLNIKVDRLLAQSEQRRTAATPQAQGPAGQPIE